MRQTPQPMGIRDGERKKKDENFSQKHAANSDFKSGIRTIINFKKRKKMEAINFPEVNQEIGKDQNEYITLPSKIIMDVSVPVWNAWKPTKEELERLNKGEAIWLAQLTFGRAFHPVKMQVEKPDFAQLDKEADEETDKIIRRLNKEIKAGNAQLNPEEMKEFRERCKERGLKAEEMKENPENEKECSTKK